MCWVTAEKQKVIIIIMTAACAWFVVQFYYEFRSNDRQNCVLNCMQIMIELIWNKTIWIQFLFVIVLILGVRLSRSIINRQHFLRDETTTEQIEFEWKSCHSCSNNFELRKRQPKTQIHWNDMFLLLHWTEALACIDALKVQ